MYSATVIFALMYALGVFLHELDEGFMLILILSLIFVTGFMSIIKKHFNISLLIYTLVFCTGIIRCNSFITKDSALNDYAYKYAYVTGTICDIPKTGDDYYSYTVQTESFLFESNELTHKCIMNITSTARYKFGDKVCFYGVLKPYSENINSVAFDAKKYYNTKSIFFKMHSRYCEYISANTIDDLRFFTSKIRNDLYNIIARNQDHVLKGMSEKIFLNFSHNFDANLKDDFSKAGTWKYLYSSRIHFVIILCIFTLLNRLLNKKIRDFIMFFVIILYVFVNRDSGTVLRISISCLISLIYVYKNGTHNFSDSFSSMIFAAGFINPLMFYNTGFILSAVSCISIYIFYQPLKKIIRRFIKSSKMSKFISLYIIFMVINAPVTLALGLDLSLYSFPLMPVFLILNILCFILAPFYFIFNTVPIFEASLHFIYRIMILVTKLIKNLPGASLYPGHPDLIFMFTWYCGMFCMRYKVLRKYFITAFATLSVILIIHEAMRLNDIEVHFVSVGQGDAAVISLPYKTTVLTDTGGTENFSDYNHGEEEFVPYLKFNVLSTIDAALISHFHSDHAIGMISVMQNFKVDKLYLPYHDENDEICKELISTAEKSGTNIIYVSDRQTIDFTDDLKATVINTSDTAENENLNEKCAVYKFEYGDFSVLFTGDIGNTTENKIISKGYDIDCDVLKVPHHGSKNSSSDEFLEASSPEFAIAGIGFNNVHGFPAKETLERYKNHNISFYSTAASGNILIKADKKANIKLYRN